MIADRLKKAVLQAAIQGKLTEQLAEDGDARDILTKIHEEKNGLIKSGEIRKDKHVAKINEDDIPFEIPSNWCWCLLHDISIKIHYGFTAPAQTSGRVKMLRITDIQDNTVNWNNVPYCKISDYKLPSYILNNRDIVIARTGGTVGKTYIINQIDQPSVFASYLIRVVLFNEVYEHYVKLFMESELYWMQLNEKSQGTGQPNVNAKALKDLLLPLPPLSEQHRVVEKIEEILPEIESLNVDENSLEKIQQSFPTQMKSSILQAAIQGKLTEQSPEDGDARDLLEEIKAEKGRLIKAGKIKKEKPLPVITEDEIPFDIPENWCWVRLGEITFNRGQKKPDKEFTYIEISSIDNRINQLADVNNILQPNNAPSRARKIVYLGDVIYATVRPYLHNICIIDRIIDPEPIVSTGFAVVSSTNKITNKFLFRCFLTPMFDKYANDNENAKGVAYPAINNRKFLNALIPLPPLAEQKRIVNRLEELLPLCDELE
jgi:type I restriction enzyme, S subunit